jgi:hypothetical protein
MFIKRSIFNARIALVLFAVTLGLAEADASSLRYFGNGVNDIDRVKIRIDDPTNGNPGPPADVGAGDFTIEFWLIATADNSAGAISCGANYNWINGNVVLDRDRFNQGRTYGVSLGAGRPVFAVQNASFQSQTICATTDLRDGSWHHIAIQRRRSDGFMWLYVDGSLEASANGPDGDISYPDDGQPGNFCGGPCTDSDPFIVIGAEKHDAGAQYPSFSGWVDELRISSTLRYTSGFVPSQVPFVADADTAALYHFDEGSGDFIGDAAANSLSPGERRFGGSPPGPQWVSETPFAGGGGGSPGTLAFSAPSYSASEGDPSGIVASVTRSGGSAGIVSVAFSTSNGSAIAGSDYQPQTGSLTWGDGDAGSRSIVVSLLDDTTFEGDESLGLALSNPSGGASLGSPSSVTLTIQDNDLPDPGQVQLGASSYSIAESGGFLTVTVARVGGSNGQVSVDYALSDVSATGGVDYALTSGTLVWADGDQTNRTFDVAITDDAEAEGNETAQISITNPTGGATLGNPSSAQLTIVDNDAATPGEFRFGAETVSVGEAQGSLVINVRRIGGSDGQVQVPYTVSEGTATSGADYGLPSGQLLWSDGDTADKTITIPILDDNDVEGDETINVALQTPTGGGTLGTPSSLVVTIIDDDAAASPGSVQFGSASISVQEDEGVATVTVTRTGGTDGQVSVSYSATDRTAAAGLDYTATSGTLTWADGDASPQQFTVTILDDDLVEGDEIVDIGLSNAVGGVMIGAPDSIGLTIIDNDVLSPGQVQLGASSYSIAESGGFLTVTVARVGGSNGQVSVDYALSDVSATGGVDYALTSGTLVWADGDQTNRTFDVAITDDAEAEGNETAQISITNPTGGATLGNPSSAQLTIVDNDAATPGEFRFGAETVSVGEAQGSLVINVRRIGGSDGQVQVPYTVSEGTATSGADYGLPSGQLLWSDGDTADKTITIPILDDNDVEGDETINVALQTPTGGGTLGTPSSLVVTIIDDDAAASPGSVQFGSASISVQEDEGVATVTVTRTGGTDGQVSVSYSATDRTAAAGLDYTATSGTLTWADGDASPQQFTVTILDDDLVEGDEIVDIGLSNAVGGVMIGAPDSIGLTIIDNDVLNPGLVQFTSANYSIGETQASASISISRVSGSDGSASVGYRLTDQSAIAGLDYQAVSGTLNWADGESGLRSFDVPILDDSQFEGDETLILELINVSGAASGSQLVAELTIVDDEVAASGFLQFSSVSISVSEGDGSVSLSITRVGGSDGAIEVEYELSSGTAISGDDFQNTPGTISWPDGDASDKTISVPIINDNIREGSETFTVTLLRPTGGSSIGTPDSATVTILDDDNVFRTAGGGGGSSGVLFITVLALLILSRRDSRIAAFRWRRCPDA